jgi:TetR/AcrR family transcriptional regulator
MYMANKPNPETPGKIFEAASELFASQSFDSISVKDIANKANVNSALISYYYGGKAKLYQSVLLEQANVFVATIAKVAALPLKPLDKIKRFMDDETEMQLRNGNNIHIIYREMLSPTPEGEVVVKDHLFKVQDYLSQFIADGVADGSLKKGLDPKHTAFALESILAFFFMAKNHIRDAFGFEETTLKKHLTDIYTDYINSLVAGEAKNNADA